MEIFQILLWIVYPYVVLAVLGMGIVWQMDVEDAQAQNIRSVKHSKLLSRTVLGLMILSVLTGLAVIYYTRINHEPKLIFEWVVSLIRFRPNTEIIRNISFLSRAHFMVLLTFILLISLTNYLPYLLRPHRLFQKLVRERKNAHHI
ncbi:respiratory nitrate reductase subunit gamma [Cytobacillus sp. Hz8]|uniref:respiratory nitrate reductase subunit gamma n=1 Tax=Cytobacillus sp. Hz8 TaxID=3347168 RepID=UPI0035E15B0A